MIAIIKQNNAFLKKMFLSFITVCSLFIVVGLSNNVSANVNKHVPVSGVSPNSSWKYYGNGLSCNAFNCRVNWGATWSEGVKRWGDNLFGSVSGPKW